MNKLLQALTLIAAIGFSGVAKMKTRISFILISIIWALTSGTASAAPGDVGVGASSTVVYYGTGVDLPASWKSAWDDSIVNTSRGVASSSSPNSSGSPCVICTGGNAHQAGYARGSVDLSAHQLKAMGQGSVAVSTGASLDWTGNVSSVGMAWVDDIITLSAPATVWVTGIFTGHLDAQQQSYGGSSGSASIDAQLAFCNPSFPDCRPIGGWSYFDSKTASPFSGGGYTTVDPCWFSGGCAIPSLPSTNVTFAVPVNLPAGTSSFNGHVGTRIDVLASDGSPGGWVDATSDFGSTLNFQIVVPNGVTATSASGLLPIQAAVVPVPAAVWLFGSGLLGLIGVARRKTRTP